MRRVQKRSLVLWCGSLILLSDSASAIGSPDVFATDSISTTVNSGEYDLPKNNASTSVFLYIEFGGVASAGEPCVLLATGEETCGFDVTVEVEGDAFIVDFFPASSVESFPAQGNFDSTSRALHAVGLTADNPAPGEQLIGELVLDTTGPLGGKIVVNGVAAVRADLEKILIETQQVATTDLPEPNSILVLIAGILAIRVLHSLRSHRSSFFPAHADH